jgi:FkbM family methyltransferase
MAESAPFWVSLSASAIRTLPFGRYQLANALARFAKGPFVARMPADLGGAAFFCDLQDTISREVCFTGRYEPQETQLALRILQPGMSAVDVGANWGYFTLLCAHLVGGNGRVLTLEPHPHLASILAGNVRSNQLSHVQVRTMAAAAGPGVRAFIGYDERGGNWGVSRTARDREAPDFKCETAALDTLLDELGWNRVDLVKVDIEGAEAEAIRGMTEGLARRRYRYVLLECHPAELSAAGASIEQCLEPFSRAGYRGWHIDHSMAMHRRAAARPIPAAELLAPIDPRALASDEWPHFLWAAPGEPVPA